MKTSTHKAILSAAAICLTTLSVGCSTSKFKPVLMDEHIPDFFVNAKYGTEPTQKGEFTAAGFGRGNDMIAALEKAILDAEVAAIKAYGGNKIHSTTKSLTKKSTSHGNEASKNKGHKAGTNDQRGLSEEVESFGVLIESNIDKELPSYRIVKKEVFKRKNTYEAFVLITNKSDKDDFFGKKLDHKVDNQKL